MKCNPLREAIRLALLPVTLGTLALAAPVVAQDSDDDAATLDRIEVTGSRIKRADIEGALPVTVISREDIDLSGELNVADLLRNTTFNSFGSFRPRSGSAGQATASLNLRGIGSGRTLILIDGRRAPVSAMGGTNQDLNAIPLAAIERVEVLSDGASAIYGSDAIGGVVNIITRKDFNGVEMQLGASNPSRSGGETEDGSVIFGASGDRGALIAGVSYANRGIVFQRERPWSNDGASTFSNNFQNPNGTFFSAPSGPTQGTSVVPGGCSAPAFSVVGNRCLYNFALVAADEAELRNSALFARGTYQINDDWATYMNASVSRVESFGRYAPSLATAAVPASSPNNPFGTDLRLRHRFAALGTRDDTVDANAYDFMVGFQGAIGPAFVEFGARINEFRSYNLGRNYVVIPIANQFIADGTYNIFNPFGNSAATLNAMKATISRDSFSRNEEVFALANFDLFDMAGGMASLAVGAEARKESYFDTYDSLSEAGVIGGSAGSSSGGSRDVTSAYFEALFPVLDKVEVSLAARYDKYSDYGNDTSPKIGLRWQPLETLTLRASYGEGFAAPSIPILTQQPSFAADFVTDPATCVVFGLTPNCTNPVTGATTTPQTTAWVIANPNLSSETSTQYSLGFAWDATDWLNLSLDYYNIEVDNQITPVTTNTIIACLGGSAIACPPGLSMLPTTAASGLPFEQAVPNPQLGLGLARDPGTGGILYVQRGFTNLGKLETNGLDLNVRTNFDFADWGALASQVQVGWVNKLRVNGGRNLVGDERTPQYRVSVQNVYTYGDFTLGWNISHIADTDSRNALGNPPRADLPLDLPSWTTHDLQLTWAAPWNGKITVGVQNIADKDPVLDPLDPTGRGYDMNLYDGYGRVPYVRYTQSF
ncbi:TonB-dependent receptor plug domain-containing protein [Pseudomarimonas salicorniae]|uniref:TonB-dependent receptor n=1 Tax=Pseudomarimonas salicorniae TaxID=2933270 RepID=A0ABT0GG77_9GAMM|nr:TonB-dependent receptor [Lysobacter sp. CAU 1642]MCK7593541.1 TonB-dependent receptor [Lysobacter sp. CAU 1642]